MKIIDDKLSPYQIHVNGSNYEVCEPNGQDKKGSDLFKTHSYCSNMTNAIKKVAKLKTEAKETHSLESYVWALKAFNDSITEAIGENA
jgi:hypothetical protein